MCKHGTHADLSESAVVEHCYLICTLYGTQPVSNDKHRATWGEGGGREEDNKEREEGERKKTTRRGRRERGRRQQGEGGR